MNKKELIKKFFYKQLSEKDILKYIDKIILCGNECWEVLLENQKLSNKFLDKFLNFTEYCGKTCWKNIIKYQNLNLKYSIKYIKYIKKYNLDELLCFNIYIPKYYIKKYNLKCNKRVLVKIKSKYLKNYISVFDDNPEIIYIGKTFKGTKKEITNYIKKKYKYEILKKSGIILEVENILKIANKRKQKWYELVVVLKQLLNFN